MIILFKRLLSQSLIPPSMVWERITSGTGLPVWMMHSTAAEAEKTQQEL
jgi:hypothetical protein